MRNYVYEAIFRAHIIRLLEKYFCKLSTAYIPN